jgi:hypothetical protein
VSLNQDHADGHGEQHSSNASGDGAGRSSNVPHFNGPHISHGVAQDTIHSHIASLGTGVFNVHDEDLAMYPLSTSTYLAQGIALHLQTDAEVTR